MVFTAVAGVKIRPSDAGRKPFSGRVFTLHQAVDAVSNAAPHARRKSDEVDRGFSARHLRDGLDEVCGGRVQRRDR